MAQAEELFEQQKYQDAFNTAQKHINYLAIM